MKSKQHSAVFTSHTVPWLYLAPTIIILLMFIYYPALKVLVSAFYRDNFFLGTMKFIGLENFKMMWTGPLAPAFRQVLVQTVLFSLCIVCLSIGTGLTLAVLSNKKIKGAKIYRMLLIWPFALSSAVAGMIFTFMFNPEVGIVNELLGKIFNVKVMWLSAPVPAFIVTVAAAVWKNIGYNIVFYLAALQNIPNELLEAAEIDGASGFQKFKSILFPLLSPTTFFLVFTNITYSFFDSFGIIDVLTKGAPVGTGFFGNTGVTTTLMYNMFIEGFGGSSNMGFAGAQSVILLIVVAVISVLQFSVFGKKVQYDV